MKHVNHYQCKFDLIKAESPIIYKSKIDILINQIEYDLIECKTDFFISNDKEKSDRRRRIISNVIKLKNSSQEIQTEQNMKFPQFIIKKLGILTDDLLEFLEAYDQCIQAGKPDVFFKVNDYRTIKEILSNNECLLKKIEKFSI